MKTRAFSLVEVTAALGIASFCIIAVFGLLPTGLNSNKAAIEQTAATNLLTAIDADLRTAPNPAPGGTAQTSPQFGIEIPAAGGTVTPQGSPITKFVAEDGRVVSAASARYLLSIWMTPPSTTREATRVRLLLSWPASATADKAAGSVDTVIALNRN